MKASDKCHYCGIRVGFEKSSIDCSTLASLDQILPGGGYIRKNLVLCCKSCNIIKWTFFLDFARRLINYFARFCISTSEEDDTLLAPVSELREDERFSSLFDSDSPSDGIQFVSSHQELDEWVDSRWTAMRHREARLGEPFGGDKRAFRSWAVKAVAAAFCYEEGGHLFIMAPGGIILPLNFFSPDRLDSNLGYRGDNLQLLPVPWNYIKSNHANESLVIKTLQGYWSRRNRIRSLLPSDSALESQREFLMDLAQRNKESRDEEDFTDDDDEEF